MTILLRPAGTQLPCAHAGGIGTDTRQSCQRSADLAGFSQRLES